MMSIPTFQNEIAGLLRSDPALTALLPGGVWIRRIKPNDGTAEAPTPGSTPAAFDHAGRIKRCAAVLNGTGAVVNPLGPEAAFYAFPEIWLRCLPHESEKQKLEEAAQRIIAIIRTAGRVSTPGGTATILTVAARMMPDDDPDLPPAVVDMIRVQADGVWRITE
jgi:hypothetical protein